MSLEDRVRASVDAALDNLRTRVEGEMRQLVDQLVAAAIQDRDQAVNTARRQSFDEAWDQARREAAEQSTRALAAADGRIQEALVNAELRFVQQQREAEEQATRQLEAARDAADRVLEQAAQHQARILHGIRGLDEAATLSGVLDAMGRSIGHQAARTAVLMVRADRLVGWKLSGFGPRDLQPNAVDISLADAGLAGRAVIEGRLVSGGAASTGLLIDEPPGTIAIAVPVSVGGRVVAVAYASQPSEAATVDGWQEAVEIVVRHGARCLEALTVQKAAAPPTPRFWVPSDSGTTDGTVAHAHAVPKPRTQ
jgi:hypothetical protein